MLRFALIGCGRIAQKHIDAIAKLESAELVAVADTNDKRASQIGKQCDVPFYKNYLEMLNDESIDVVNILTPSGLHAKNVLDIASFKKHIVVEKPMALTLNDADAMIKACDENGVKLFVVKQNRYNLPVLKLAEAVKAGRFGKPVLGTVRVRWCRDQKYYDQDDWRGTWAMDGGVFANQASHHIDLLEWLMGDVESVFAKSATHLVNIEVEDTGVVLLKFCNGALGVIEATTATRPKDLEGSISILGENGSVEISGFAVNEMKVWNFKEAQEHDADVLKNYSQNPPDVYGFGHQAYLQNVVDCILHNKKALVDGLEGRKSLELIHAIYESIETGKEIILHFTPKKCRLGLINNDIN